MELTRYTKIQFVLSDPKVVSHQTAMKRQKALEDRFPNAAVSVMSSASFLVSLSFENEHTEQMHTDAAMKHVVKTICEKFP